MICSDVLGVFQAFTPKFVKKYENIADKTVNAFTEYVKDVRSREFPKPEHTYKMVEGSSQVGENLPDRIGPKKDVKPIKPFEHGVSDFRCPDTKEKELTMARTDFCYPSLLFPVCLRPGDFPDARAALSR